MGVFGGILATFGATIAAAILGSAASISASEFYGSLVKPTWAPPAGVFGPVWTVLYVMIAISGWLIYRSDAPNTKMLLGVFVAHLAVNALWSWTFFRWDSGLGSVMVIVALWLMILWLVVAFWRVKPFAGALLIPYLLWVTFAAALNIAVWRLNPVVL